jgi:cholesterol oxidase
MGDEVRRAAPVRHRRSAPVQETDVVVVGSGFGGSVAALRLAEKGYRVVVLEAGRRFADADFARTSWDLRRFLWAPRLGCYGIQRIHRVSDSLILAGAGVGGGSLVYGNTLYRPLPEFFADLQWSRITDWAAELAPWYDQASRMLGVVDNPTTTAADVLFRRVAEHMGVGDTFRTTPVGVHLGTAGVTVPDPYFGGAGPARTGCTECGACMTGCRVGAKNTLPKNYLHLAERAGVTVVPMTTVERFRPDDDAGGWLVEARTTGGRRRTAWRAAHVVLAAGTYNTQLLLHRAWRRGDLPHLSSRLGHLTRTNSEAIVGGTAPRVDPDRPLHRGVAITSSFFPEPHTHVEPVRYAAGSNAMALLQTVLTTGGPRSTRWLKILAGYAREVARGPVRAARTLTPYRWSERTAIALVMQSLDNSLVLRLRRGPLGTRLVSRQGPGEPNPTWIPSAHRTATLLAQELGGIAGGSWGDVANMPLTAHFLGGCPIGATADDGVLDPYQRVHGHPTLHVVDGAAVTGNLGVNPSLTITAQAERAVALWPNAGEPDPRPQDQATYRRVDPVPPQHPAVPDRAPGRLWTAVTPSATLSPPDGRGTRPRPPAPTPRS